MLSSAQIKHIRSLHHKKFREHLKLFLVEGDKLVQELLQSNWEVEWVFATPDYLNRMEHILKNHGYRFTKVSFEELCRISLMKHPHDVLAIVKMPETPSITNLDDHDLILMLDHISDPGNLGNIIRIADWFGIRLIVCSPDTVEVYNPKVVQATMGSIFRTTCIYHDLKTFLERHSGNFTSYGAILGGTNIFQIPLADKAIVVIGNESHGISPEILSKLNFRVTIPSFNSQAESLNASAATAVLCTEFRRKKLITMNIT